MTMASDKRLGPKHRQSEYTAETGAAICERIVEGESLRKICSDSDMPTRDTVRHWCAQHTDFREDFASAESLAADFLMEETIGLVDDCPLWVEKVYRGKVVTVQARQQFARCRLRVEVRWWVVEQKRPSKRRKNS
jgi:hypothetical protein